ncbi:MAG: glycosyltransferase family 2 protein [Candidatus Aminicenantes bacterium]|nr:glycosyltransferase family 2 protein [Candidatus Aminicenantes bacterium]
MPEAKNIHETQEKNTNPPSELSVLVVLVHWKYYSKTLGCLKSLTRQNHRNIQIVLVNNDPEPFRMDLIDKSQHVNVLNNKKNLGFTKACNQGLRKAMEIGGDYVLVLNNDTFVQENFLSPLLSTCENNRKWIVGPVCYHFGQKKIENAGGRILSWLGVCRLTRKKSRKAPDYLSGACFLVRMNILKDVGLFKEEMIMYFEDTEWSLRAVSKGYKLRIVPESIIWHKHVSKGQGKKEWSDLKCYFIARNHFYFARTCFRGPRRWLWLFSYLMIGSHLHLILFCRRISTIKCHFSGIYDGLLMRQNKNFLIR